MPEFQFDGFADFLEMGGYATYVWLSYGAFFVFLIINIVPPLVTKRDIFKKGKRLSAITQEND